MKSIQKFLPSWADYRISVGVLIIAGILGAVVVLNIASGQNSPDDEVGKAERAAATPDLSQAPCKDTAQCPPPLPRSRFINEEGFFKLPEWDDRNLSEQEKTANPWRDPFWPSFVRCLQDAGIGVGLTTPDGATQEDINRLVEEVNQHGPFYTPSPTGLVYRATSESDAFIRCEKILYERRPNVTLP